MKQAEFFRQVRLFERFMAHNSFTPGQLAYIEKQTQQAILRTRIAIRGAPYKSIISDYRAPFLQFLGGITMKPKGMKQKGKGGRH